MASGHRISLFELKRETPRPGAVTIGAKQAREQRMRAMTDWPKHLERHHKTTISQLEVEMNEKLDKEREPSDCIHSVYASP
jgi:hypothetical protein